MIKHVLLTLSVLACCLTLTAGKQPAELVIKIKSAEAGLYRSADFESEIIYTATEGDMFVSVTIVKDFYLVKEHTTGNFLYVSFYDAVELWDVPPEEIYISGEMPMPDQMDLSQWQVTTNHSYAGRELTFDGGEMLTAHNGKKYPAEYDYNLDYLPVTDGEQLANDAMEYLNTEYVLGGTSKRGIDCSGLTLVCLERQGFSGLPHRSSLQALSGKYVAYENLKVGDLLFFRDKTDTRYLSHVGIYLGRNRFVHASQSMGKVVIGSLSSEYFRTHYGFARRF